LPIAICHVSLLFCIQVLFLVCNVVLLTYIQSCFCSSGKLVVVVYVGVVCCCVFGMFYVMYYVDTVGIMFVLLLVLLVIVCISGFWPPCAMICLYFCLIFAFWANIFMATLPFAGDFFLLSYLDVMATCLSRISSADSFASASVVRSCGPDTGYVVQSSLPFVEVGGSVDGYMRYMVA